MALKNSNSGYFWGEGGINAFLKKTTRFLFSNKVFLLFLFIYLAMPCGMQVISVPRPEGSNRAPCSGSTES